MSLIECNERVFLCILNSSLTLCKWEDDGSISVGVVVCKCCVWVIGTTLSHYPNVSGAWKMSPTFP